MVSCAAVKIFTDHELTVHFIQNENLTSVFCIINTSYWAHFKMSVSNLQSVFWIGEQHVFHADVLSCLAKAEASISKDTEAMLYFKV